MVEYKVDLDYDYWSAGYCLTWVEIMKDINVAQLDECLQVILPEELREGSPTGFAMTGHIGVCIFTYRQIPAVFKYFPASSCQFERRVSSI